MTRNPAERASCFYSPEKRVLIIARVFVVFFYAHFMYFWVNEVCLCWRIGGFGYVDELEEAVKRTRLSKLLDIGGLRSL